MAKYNVGIIGYGWAATAHIDAINACPDAEVVAIYSSRPRDAGELKDRYGSDIKPYRDVKKLMADENVNVVCINAKWFLLVGNCGDKSGIEFERKSRAITCVFVCSVKNVRGEQSFQMT